MVVEIVLLVRSSSTMWWDTLGYSGILFTRYPWRAGSSQKGYLGYFSREVSQVSLLGTPSLQLHRNVPQKAQEASESQFLTRFLLTFSPEGRQQHEEQEVDGK